MSVWEKYSNEERQEYIKFLQLYGALTNLFRQKKGDLIPHLDSKYQETIFAKSFSGKIVDIGNTPHDVLSVFGDNRIGIGLKTWMHSRPSYQKVMQLKSYQNEINVYKNNPEDLAYKISDIRNERVSSDYERLGLSENNNIYHYVTRDKGKFSINECAYPLIDLKKLRDFNKTEKSFSWSDGNKDYKYTFGDSQIWQKFDATKYKSILLKTIDIKIVEDPFSFLLKAYTNLINKPIAVQEDTIEAYLPLYSFKSKEVEEKSGLNAWRAAPKNKNSNIPRPLNEVYIPIPKEFHKFNPSFFNEDILSIIDIRNQLKGTNQVKPEVRFHLILPNGKKIPALLTGDNMKNFQSGSNIENDENGKRFGQNALGQWLLVDVLGLKERKKVTREWLIKKGKDSVRLWRKKGDYSTINIDFAPVGAFEAYMNSQSIPEDDE